MDKLISLNIPCPSRIDASCNHLTHRQQILMVNSMYLSLTCENERYLVKELKSKLSSYAQQDKLKHRYEPSLFITYDYLLQKLVESQLKCFYCQCQIMLLYEETRQKNQWTLDRIDNGHGHNYNNVLVSCLKCNLQRRKTGMEQFNFTKKLKISKINT